jgi:two-component system response regulator PilR (NtrC family)
MAKILIVDQDARSRSVTGELVMSKFDLQVLEADSVKDALSTLKMNRITLIVSDYKLKDGFGLDIVNQLEEVSQADPYFILFTGSEVPQSIQAEVPVVVKPNFRLLITAMARLELFPIRA